MSHIITDDDDREDPTEMPSSITWVGGCYESFGDQQTTDIFILDYEWEIVFEAPLLPRGLTIKVKVNEKDVEDIVALGFDMIKEINNE